MKKTNWTISVTLLLTVGCSTGRTLHERDPASLLDSCRNAIASFLGTEAPRGQRMALDVDRNYVINNHRNNNFTTGRNLGQYMMAFNRSGSASLSLKKDLEKLKVQPDGHWLDAGGGMGLATEEATKVPGAKFKTTLVSVETDAEEISDQTGAVRRKVIKGKFIEDIADDEIPKSDLITDLYGPLAYSSRPDQVLRKYINNLKQSGVAYIYLGEDLDTFGIFDQIITRNGDLLNLTEWLEAIEGLKVEVIKMDAVVSDTNIIRGEKSRVAKISLKKSASEIHIPALERLSFQQGGSMDGFIVPRMIFKETEKGMPAVLPNNKGVANSLRHFVTDFRTGEFEHPILDQLNSMTNMEWAHFSNEELNWDLLPTLNIKDENYFDLSSKRLLSRFKIAADKNIRPEYTSVSQLKGKMDLKLISDHNATIISADSPDKILKIYLDALADDGKIVLNMGEENLGLSKIKILDTHGSYITMKKWLEKIPGINVSMKRTKISEPMIRKLILNDGSLKEYVSMENTFSEVFVITIKKREQINIPPLKFLGKTKVNDRGFELPIYSQ